MMAQGAISYQEAMGGPPASQPAAAPTEDDNHVYSYNEAMGIAPPTAPQPSKSLFDLDKLWSGKTDFKQTAETIAAAAKQNSKELSAKSPLWDTFTVHIKDLYARQQENAASALAKMQRGKEDMLSNDDTKILPLQNWKGLGEGLLGMWQYMTSPLQTLVDEAVSKPSSMIVNKIGSMVPTAPELKPGEQRPQFDTAIRPSDVRQTTNALNTFLETAYNTAAGYMMGGPKAEGRGVYDMLTPEAKAEFTARKPRAEAKMESAFDELAAKDNQSAHHVADQVANVDIILGQRLHEKADKWNKAADADYEDLGRRQAKESLSEMLGKMPKDMIDVPPNGAPKPPGPVGLPAGLVKAEAVSAKVSKAIEEAIPESPKTDDIVMMNAGLNLATTKAGRILSGKLAEYYDYIIRQLNPEALGADAQKGGAIVAKGLARLAQRDSARTHLAEEFVRFWESQKNKQDFITAYERGDKFTDPKWKTSAQRYESWNKDIMAQDRRNGVVEYDEAEHYLSHMYKDPEAARLALRDMFGPSWNRPGFTKERAFDTYEQALKAGKKYEARGLKNPFEPKFTNPEMIMLARQHASDLAEMRIQILRDMERHGLAVKTAKGERGPGPGYRQMSSPDGNNYFVKNDAHQILENAFNSASLWNLKGPPGDLFRGIAFLKNAKVQVQLGLSLYHMLHIGLAMDSSAAMVRATKELAAGKTNPISWFARVVKAPVDTLWSNYRAGSPILRAYRGQVNPSEMSEADRTAMKFMAEGGFIPEMSSQYRTKAVENFRRAIAAGSGKALWHLPFAVLELMSRPLFDHWIPSLKINSYLKDVQTHLKLNPEHLKNDIDRMVAFRKLAKSVEDRYGEMAYNTMFMNRMLRDIAVIDTLSLGWQLGLIRAAGGGMLDLGHVLTSKGGVAQKAKMGLLDRPLMLSFYAGQTLLMGGLITWAMTGKKPETLQDYYLPQTGEQNPDGSPKRMNTMFYTKEAAQIAKRMQIEGVASGLKDTLLAKESGVRGMIWEAMTGMDSWGYSLRDPDETPIVQAGQTLRALMPEFEPISLVAIQKQPGSTMLDKVTSDPKATARTILGFTPAAKYMTQSETEGKIDYIYRTQYAKKAVGYEKAQYSKASREAREAYDNGDMQEFEAKLEDMREKYDLNGQEIRRLRKDIQRQVDPEVRMFEGFDREDQKRLMDKMTPEELEKFQPHSNKHHLRKHYEQPAEVG